ncbi:MAG: hypothetical protein DRP01_02515 [Archaeoglobales archaeon]|nr:MAG: hypothetical protein DRP01_02515 [Archaeoglobales archaeon]
MLEDIMARDEWAIIILDACRYDYFKKLINNYIPGGALQARRSPGSCTLEFLNNEFRGRYDCIVISSNGFLQDRPIKHPDGWYFNGLEHFRKVVNLFSHNWSDELMTVPPWEVNKVALENIEDRMLIWYIQPHFPAIGKVKLIMNANQIKKAWKAGRLSLSTIRLAYEYNLRLVLSYVAKLIKRLPHKLIVITSDHAELLGEGGKFNHPCCSNSPILRTVPFYIIKSKNLA